MNQLKAGVILNYIVIGLNTILGLGYTPYMLKCLGQNEYGLYSLVGSIIAYLTVLDFGFGNAIIRYTAKFRAEQKCQEQWEMFGMFLIVYSIIGLIAIGGGLCLYFNVDLLFDKTMSSSDLSQARIMMLLLTVNLGITFPLSIFGSIITAYENFVFQRVVQIIKIVVSTTVLIVVLTIGYKAVALVVIDTIFNISILVINYFYCINKLRIKIIFQKFDWPFIKEITSYSFWVFINSIMDRIYWGTGQFVLGAVSGTIAVAIFSVAITLQRIYMQFSGAISSVLLPRITAMVSKHKSDKEISDLFISTGRIQAIVMLLILTGFIIFGKEFIELWAGKDYSSSYSLCLCFFISLFIPLIQSVGFCVLQARKHLKFRAICYLIFSILSLVGQIFLSKPFGPLGCAFAIALGFILGHGLIMNIYYYKIEKLDVIEFWKEIGSLAAYPLLLTFVWYVIYHLVFSSDTGWINLIIQIFMYIIIFVLGGWFLSLNEKERDLLKRLLCVLKK